MISTGTLANASFFVDEDFFFFLDDDLLCDDVFILFRFSVGLLSRRMGDSRSFPLLLLLLLVFAGGADLSNTKVG